MTDHFTSSTGHTWPCTGFYVTSSEEDRTVRCTCGKKADHLEAAIQAGAERAELIRQSCEIGWNAAVKAIRYEDGTPVEIASMINPYALPQREPTND